MSSENWLKMKAVGDLLNNEELLNSNFNTDNLYFKNHIISLKLTKSLSLKQNLLLNRDELLDILPHINML